jgi:hypothetical protein
MDQLPVSSRILITLCFLSACLMGAVSLLAVVFTTAELGGGLPLRYFEQLNFPALTVLLPVVGMLAIGVAALVSWFKEEKAAGPAVVENVVPAVVTPKPRAADVYPQAA